MLNLIKRNYWWPEIKTDIKKYIQECQKSQQNKVQYMKKTVELHSLEISQGPWQEISINIIEPLSKSKDKDIIVVIVNQFTNMIQLKTTTIVISLVEIAKTYRYDI